MASLKKYTKQPVEQLDYDIDYSDWLAPDDELISAIVTVEDLNDVASVSPIVIESSLCFPSFVKVWISGGTSGEVYKVICTITTSRDRIKQYEIKFRVIDY